MEHPCRRRNGDVPRPSPSTEAWNIPVVIDATRPTQQRHVTRKHGPNEGALVIPRPRLRPQPAMTGRRQRPAAVMLTVMLDPDAPPPLAISRAEALANGLTDGAIRHRLTTGRWQVVFPGAYAPFSGPVPRQTRLEAAVRYAGRAAALSHETAAAVQGWRPHPGSIHVTVPAARRVDPQPGLVVHRSRNWATLDVVDDYRAPRTTVRRTLLDLVDAAPDARRAVAIVTDCVRSRLVGVDELAAAVVGRRRLRHQRLVLATLEDAGAGVESMLEADFAQTIRLHGLPEPERQVRVVLPDGRVIYLDTLFRPFLVIAELDGRLGHSAAEDRFRDVDRDNAAALLGCLPLRLGSYDVVARPCTVAHRLGAILTARGWTGTLKLCGPSCAP